MTGRRKMNLKIFTLLGAILSLSWQAVATPVSITSNTTITDSDTGYTAGFTIHTADVIWNAPSLTVEGPITFKFGYGGSNDTPSLTLTDNLHIGRNGSIFDPEGYISLDAGVTYTGIPADFIVTTSTYNIYQDVTDTTTANGFDYTYGFTIPHRTQYNWYDTGATSTINGYQDGSSYVYAQVAFTDNTSKLNLAGGNGIYLGSNASLYEVSNANGSGAGIWKTSHAWIPNGGQITHNGRRVYQTIQDPINFGYLGSTYTNQRNINDYTPGFLVPDEATFIWGPMDRSTPDLMYYAITGTVAIAPTGKLDLQSVIFLDGGLHDSAEIPDSYIGRLGGVGTQYRDTGDDFNVILNDSYIVNNYIDDDRFDTNFLSDWYDTNTPNYMDDNGMHNGFNIPRGRTFVVDLSPNRIINGQMHFGDNISRLVLWQDLYLGKGAAIDGNGDFCMIDAGNYNSVGWGFYDGYEGSAMNSLICLGDVYLNNPIQVVSPLVIDGTGNNIFANATPMLDIVINDEFGHDMNEYSDEVEYSISDLVLQNVNLVLNGYASISDYYKYAPYTIFGDDSAIWLSEVNVDVLDYDYWAKAFIAGCEDVLIYGDVSVNGRNNVFIPVADQSSIVIFPESRLHFGPELYVGGYLDNQYDYGYYPYMSDNPGALEANMYIPNGISPDRYSFVFADPETSVLHLENCAFFPGPQGTQLTNGKLVVDGDVRIYNFDDYAYVNTEPTRGLVLGDGDFPMIVEYINDGKLSVYGCMTVNNDANEAPQIT